MAIHSIGGQYSTYTHNQPARYMHTGHKARAQTRNGTSLPIPSICRSHPLEREIIKKFRFQIPDSRFHGLSVPGDAVLASFYSRSNELQEESSQYKITHFGGCHHPHGHMCLHVIRDNPSLKTGEMKQWVSNASKRTETGTTPTSI